MAINVTLDDITSGYNISKINVNFQTLETALLKAVSTDGQANNFMTSDFDMNGQDIINVGSLSLQSGDTLAEIVGYAEEWANKAEDSLVSTAAGGDGVDDYSSLHHANKASASATNASTSETNAATSETNAATSASNAATSETNASTSETNALAASNAVATRWNFDSSTSMVDPGPGDLRFNNATVSSVTAIAVDDEDANAVDISAFVVTWDDSTNTNKGTITVRKGSAPGTFATFTLTGLTDNAGWSEFAVTYVDGNGTFSDTDELYVEFSRAGDKGADGAGAGDVVGPASSTDEAVARFDSTTGKLLQNSSVTISDAGALSAASLSLTTDLPVTEGGTGASDAATARTNLGAQAQDDLLDDITAITAVSGDILYVDGSANIVNLAKGSDGEVLTLASGFPSWGGGAGEVVQRVSVVDSAVATGTTVHVADDTIPQNTEGNEFMTLAITPNDTSNILVIDVHAMMAAGASNTTLIGALFQDSTADAIASTGFHAGNGGRPEHLVMRHIMTAGTVSSTTFKFRGGPSNAGTTTFNGEGSARLFGGVAASSIMITEYKP